MGDITSRDIVTTEKYPFPVPECMVIISILQVDVSVFSKTLLRVQWLELKVECKFVSLWLMN